MSSNSNLFYLSSEFFRETVGALKADPAEGGPDATTVDSFRFEALNEEGS